MHSLAKIKGIKENWLQIFHFDFKYLTTYYELKENRLFLVSFCNII